MAVEDGIAVPAEDLTLGAVEEGSVQAAVTLEAGEAVLVVGATLGHHPLRLKDLGLAAKAGILIRLVCGKGCLVSKLVASARPIVATVADFAVDLIVRALNSQEVVQLVTTFDAGKAFLVV